MDQPTQPPQLQKILVLNPKGGSGKSTIATNLAAYYAWRGLRVALMDHDPQGSSMRWLKLRPAGAAARSMASPPIEKKLGVTRSFALRTPPGTERLIVDTPAAVSSLQMPELTQDAQRDRRAGAALRDRHPRGVALHRRPAARRQVHRSERRIVIVANRARRYTKAYTSLMRFLQSLRIPVAAVLRDSQAYVRSAECGMGIHEMKGALLQEDLDSWQATDRLARIDARRSTPLLGVELAESPWTSRRAAPVEVLTPHLSR